jgi:TolA-binding protein
VRSETRRSLKEDRFRNSTLVATEAAVHWTVEHKSKLIFAGVALAVILAAAIGGWYYLQAQDQKASFDLNKAVRTMSEQVRPEGVPPQPGFPSFGSNKERATEARKQLQAIVDNYPHTKSAEAARYFLGVTSIDLGDNAAAERALREVSSSGGTDMAALAKYALAGVYRDTNRTKEAIDIYKGLIDKPTATVGKVAAQMALAATYEQSQNTAEAKAVYQQIQKENPAGQASGLAAQKLAELK